MKYAVHVFPTVRVKVPDIEASSMSEAFEKAQDMVDMGDVFDNSRPKKKNVEEIEWDGAKNSYTMVGALDDAGEVIAEKSVWFCDQGLPFIDGRTHTETVAKVAQDAIRFMNEVMDSAPSLESIAETHGVRTLADLMRLQSVILCQGQFDPSCEDSAVRDIVNGLPSGGKWMKFFEEKPSAPRETGGA